jgi:CPA2 family monovalent cation:H+ antiporter-2
MHNGPILLDIVVLLLAPVVVVPLLRRLGLSPIIGYLVAGTLIGPQVLGAIADPEALDLLAELGVAFLLFAIGLELSFERLKVMRHLVFGLGGAQVLLTGLLIGALAWLLGQPGAAALVIGGGLALSSTAFVLQLLVERGEQISRYGRAAFAILLFQDLAVAPLLALVAALGTSEDSLAAALGGAGLKALAALGLILVAGRWALRPVLRMVAATRSAELFVSAALLIVLGTGWLTTMAGLSMPLGAFLAGVLLSETEYRHQVEADLGPFRGLLLGLFFVTVGLSFDLAAVAAHWLVLLGLVAGLLLLKATLLLGLALAARLPLADALRVGLLLAQGGEFGFVLFDAALAAEVLEPGIAGLLTVAIAISMLVTPLLAQLGARLATRLHPAEPGDEAALQAAASSLQDHVVIAGFGRVGQTVGRILEAGGVPYLALDADQALVERCRAHGLPTYFGDAGRLEVLTAAGAGRARAAVLSLDRPKATEHALHALHEHFPGLQIFVRARDLRHRRQLEAHGAAAVVPDSIEASLQLGGIVLSALGGGSETGRIIEELRRSDYAGLEPIRPEPEEG